MSAGFVSVATCGVSLDEAGLVWDIVCFAMLLIQRRVFMSSYFLIVVAEQRSQAALASRLVMEKCHNRCIRVLGFSATEKRDPKKHLSLSVAICDQKHTNRVPRPKVGVSLVVRQMSRLPRRGLITTLR